MKKVYFLFSVLMSTAFVTQAQNTVTANAGDPYVGYANVFETPENGEAFVFGEVWAVADLKTVLDAGAGTITLQPNFSAWDETDPFWVDATTGLGNKYFEGNTYVEDNSLVGSQLTFMGGVQSNTLDPSYEAVAFIKVFNADFSVLKIETAPLVSGQNFSITYDNVEAGDAVVQYGYYVYGRNANPVNETALGSIVVVNQVLGVNEFDINTISTYPNPATDILNIVSQETITSVLVYNVLGQQVLKVMPQTTTYSANVSALATGAYVAQISTASGTKMTKFVKK